MSCPKGYSPCWCDPPLDRWLGSNARVLHLKPGRAREFEMFQKFEGGLVEAIDRGRDLLVISQFPFRR